MARREDPLERAADDSRDLQGIATWEPRSRLDRLLARYTWPLVRAAVVALALLIFAVVLVLLVVQVLQAPGSVLALALFPFSVLPALLLAGYVWYSDVTSEPLVLVFATFLLGVVLSAFPFVVNTAVAAALGGYFEQGLSGFLAQAGYFYLVVAPGEEAAKLGAVFLYVYWHDDFDTVVDGAVYGAVAGLGFATIENVSYIVRVLAETEGLFELFVAGGFITTVRSLAGPGHVVWTALAGYYLGLAKFNPEYAVPLTAKGLLVAAVLHGTYNTLVTGLGIAAGGAGLGLLALGVSLAFMFVYNGSVFVYLLVRLHRYRRAYAATVGGAGPPASGGDGNGE